MMDNSSQEEEKKKITEIKTYPVPFPLGEYQENLTSNTNTPSKPSKDQIINQAFKFQSEGNISEAAKYYQHFINQGFKDHRVFSNYGVILRDLGKLQEAELSTRRAIELNPNYSKAYLNLGNILSDLGKLQEAEISLRKAIELNPDYAKAHSNLGNILSDLGKLQEAEISLRKAIELNPDLAEAHYNLGGTLSNLGNLEEAELSQRKAIELQPDFARAYFSLSTLEYSNKNTIWKNNLFSETILKNKSKEDHVEIYFARANILHKQKKYDDSSKFLKLANQLKLILYPSKAEILINQSKVLLIESDKQKINQKEYRELPESIFIVGMPRSGSSLLESVLTMNTCVGDLGESDILEESFLELKEVDQKLTLAQLYWKKANIQKGAFNITTNKNLYNYQYAGIISNQIPNAKIIHCYRNPLDNILSIYRANFAIGNEYACSLIDCTKVYLNQEKIMKEYKSRFRSKIYDLNYDLLASNPNKEIKSLISWLGWKWNESYLSPHLNPRSVSTASNIQVRSPINTKSINGWKNYKDMLQPAIEILTQTDQYQDIIS